ncbi:MAG: FtsX-like permease family protein [Candidatus Bathyarchaeota archaeon]|nr:FtsX-like permease family protein [Candidatus Bathyarchaeota archaeon]
MLAVEQLFGVVKDSEGLPIPGAMVATAKGAVLVHQVKTDDSGRFNIQLISGEATTLLAYADKPSTPGWDYIPSLAKIDQTVTAYDFTLKPAASIVLLEEMQFVESENLPTIVTFTVMDTDGKQLNPSGFLLSFGIRNRDILQVPGLSASSVIIPVTQQTKIWVGSQIIVNNKVTTRGFYISPERKLLQGEKIEVDLRVYSMTYNVEVVEETLQSVKGRLSEMEVKGFYLMKQKISIAAAERKLGEAKVKLESEAIAEAYDSVKISYIALRQTFIDLETLQLDASFSIYSIVGFVAISAVMLGFLFSNSSGIKVISSLVLYMLMLIVIYIVYPGSSTIPLQGFISVGVSAFATVLGVVLFIPLLLGKAVGGEQVSLLAVIVPIFSMAKRSLMRRRLRFLLTISSIIVLVMSFVALTSFSEGYGLVTTRVSNNLVPYGGVMIRSADWKQDSPTYLVFTEPELQWLRGQQEVETVVRKAMNPPLISPLFRVEGNRIFGVIGIEPGEAAITSIGSTLIGGKLPGLGEFAASRSLCETLDIKIGDSLTVKSVPLKLSGILDDTSLRWLRDLDGDDYLPQKMININPPGDAPFYVPQTCEPEEVIFLDTVACIKMNLAFVSRLALKLQLDVNADAFAERLSLDRGYQTWSDSVKGVKYASLGTFLEGKGLPLIVPWGIVVLNVVVTMLNSLYERRREINILSAVGLNPTEIASIFVAEASIIGFIGGGIGYLAGITLYKVMPALGLAVDVHMKVSIFWSFASIGIAVSAVIVGAIVALRNSVVITPSLVRKWKIEGETGGMGEPWILTIPVKLTAGELDAFTDFIYSRLVDLLRGEVKKTMNVKKKSEIDRNIVTFAYTSAQSTTGNFFTKNKVIIKKNEEGEFIVILESQGDRAWAHETGSLLRQYAMAWSNRPRA